MKFSILILVLFIAAAGTAIAQTGGCTTRGGLDKLTKIGSKKGSGSKSALVLSTAAMPESVDEDSMAPARKKAKKVTSYRAMFSDQCRYKPGGCIPTTFPPEKPKGPKTKQAYFDADLGLSGTSYIVDSARNTLTLFAIPRCRRGGDRSNPAPQAPKPYCNQQQPWQTPGACNVSALVTDFRSVMVETAFVDARKKKQKEYTGGSFYWPKMDKH